MKELKRFPQRGVRQIGGVCAGLAYAQGWDATVTRLSALFLLLFPSVLGRMLYMDIGWISTVVFVGYLASWFVMPCWEAVPEDRKP